VTRRGFFAALVPTVGMVLPKSGITQNAEVITQFEVIGHFTEGGSDPHQAYFAIGQSLSIVLDPQKLPTMVKQAEALVGKQVRLVLEQA
jgi:hypothetical protein